MNKKFSYNIEKNNINVYFYGADLSQLEFNIKSNGTTNALILTLEDSHGKILYQCINENTIKFPTIDNLLENKNRISESTHAYSFQELPQINEYAKVHKLSIQTDDLAKFSGTGGGWKEDFKNQVKIAEDKGFKIKENFKIDQFFDELDRKIEEIQKNKNIFLNIHAINQNTGIIFDNKNNYSVAEKSTFIGPNTLEGKCYINNAKIENTLMVNVVGIDSYIQGSQINDSVINGTCLFDSIISNSIIGNGDKVFLVDNKHYSNEMAFKGRNGDNYKKPIEKNKSNEIVEKIYNEGKKSLWKDKFIKTFMVGVLAVAGMVGVAHADSSISKFSPHTDIQSIVNYANSAGYDLSKLDNDQKQFMNVDLVIQRDDKGIVSSVENHSNKILPGIGYLMEDNSPDEDYVRISTNDEGKNFTITTNSKQVTVKSDSNILGYNQDVPYLISMDAMDKEINNQKLANQQKLAASTKNLERS